ncbi:hypothetical protein TREAZ_0595 [Leadbettera azotonutricia ZAS-9]|uniref:Uncharacterized protein n=1 Tax=Leadbettera azotonutricia (strain ATCC BAA-888 / DSM 13862 / ZAS-9) TaxID=545695 RepID=F5YBI8_LEAAZ|nr:hypothetical protein TREAZ_0595 [Leadbettera azotonutricia ZAS-9]
MGARKLKEKSRKSGKPTRIIRGFTQTPAQKREGGEPEMINSEAQYAIDVMLDRAKEAAT